MESLINPQFLALFLVWKLRAGLLAAGWHAAARTQRHTLVMIGTPGVNDDGARQVATAAPVAGNPMPAGSAAGE